MTKTWADRVAVAPRAAWRNTLAELQLALEGSVQAHHRFLLAMQLRRIKNVENAYVSS